MKFQFTITFLVAFATMEVHATPMPNPDAASTGLEARADNWCKVGTNGVDCRSLPGVGAGRHIRDISTSDRFGVNCIKVVGGRTWDWVPGWGCWVSARDTLSAGSYPSCESGISRCP
ncbi:hypothetical protein BS50DRAFT_593759 [Corynespora cassiicola Philippines]|uniref:Uncharacterized protein n=1 Tax=Corynespora cassiicola Philippines TaxID=1448308 RepID=A0A2T2N5E9_CORCC|nr:hypothetical protein BS50DRAFT_593759 [Corynespora cassiicola Philippines]